MQASEQTIFTEEHSRALRIVGLVEFKLISQVDPKNQLFVLIDSMASDLLPSEGILASYKDENTLNLLMKISEWPNRKSHIAKQKFYGELALLAGLDISMLMPAYLKVPEAIKSLKSLAAITIGEELISGSQQMLNDAEDLPEPLQLYIGEQFRMFSRQQKNYTDCTLEDDDEFQSDEEAIATLISKMRGITPTNHPHYLALHLVLATILDREDYVALLAKAGQTFENLPNDLPQRYINLLKDKFKESGIIGQHEPQTSENDVESEFDNHVKAEC